MDNVWKPHVTVAAVAEHDGRYLLVEERSRGRLVINQPAGHLEDGESLVDAVIRETLEETGWRFEPDTVTGIYRWRHPVCGDTYMRFAFGGHLLERAADYPPDPDIEQALWLDMDALRGQRARLRSPMVMRCIEDHLAGRSWPLSILADVI